MPVRNGDRNLVVKYIPQTRLLEKAEERKAEMIQQ
jgi:hypothetical protein